MSVMAQRPTIEGARRVLHELARRFEDFIDARRSRSPADPVIESYGGYSTPNGVVLRGRVLNRSQPRPVAAGSSRLRNAIAMARLFHTAEVAGVEVTAGSTTTCSDDEGFFELEVAGEPSELTPIHVELPGFGVTAEPVVHHTPPDARFGVISDIDDTVMQTNAFALWRNVWTTLSGSVEGRRIFDDSASLLVRLVDEGRNPVFYVSSAPWNLHRFLTQVFERNGVPLGPMFLSDYGVDDRTFIAPGHRRHKLGHIETILNANPDLGFVLIGDTGQRDADVYLQAIGNHEGQILAVILRHAGEVDDADRRALGRLRATEVPVFDAAGFDDLQNTVVRAIEGRRSRGP